MNFAQSLAQLNQWCAQSHGEPLPGLPEGRGVFESRFIYTDSDLNVVESRLGFSLPDSYRQFMKTVGASSLFCTHVNGGGPIFYQPEEIFKLQWKRRSRTKAERLIDFASSANTAPWAI